MINKVAGIMFFACMSALMAQAYSIKGPSSPKPYEANAAKDLGDYLAKRIDGTLTVGGKSPVVFHIGDTELAKSKGLLSSQLKDEEWIIKSFDNDIILNGGGTRGALYAVYHFLEDYCDIHWWNEYEEYVPKASALALPSLDKSGRPAFLYRDIYCYGPNLGHADYAKFAIRNRLNRAGDVKVKAEFGGSFNYGPPDHCHTFEHYVPEEKYYKEHPEYFSLQKGKRVADKTHSQLCLTNPALRQIFWENLVEYVKQGEAEALKDNVPSPRIYDVSMNDCHAFCECPACSAEIEQYGHSGYMLRFVNWIAEQAETRFPALLISTLAYHECEAPPKGGVRARDNVVVKLCDTRTNQAASIFEKENRMFMEFVSEWKNHARHLFIWDYAITFANTGMPFASEFHYGDCFRHYRANNVTGVFWEHERLDVADLYELKFFLETKLMEDPNQDVNELIDFFMPRYYGAAAPFILKFRKLIEEKRRKEKAPVSWMAGYIIFNYIDDELLMQIQDIFEQAEKAVRNDETLLFHVRRARMGIDNITARRGKPVFYHGQNWTPTARRIPSAEAARRFMATHAKWTARFPEREHLKSITCKSLESYTHEKQIVAAPTELKGRNFFDCYPLHFSNEAANHAIELVTDKDSPVGEAFRIDVARSHYYNLPFAAGVYDEGNEKTLMELKFPKIEGGNGYNWFKLPVCIMPRHGYVFITREWTIQVPIPCDALYDKPFEVWISAKHVGEQFHAGQGKPEYIYVDRLVFIEPK